MKHRIRTAALGAIGLAYATAGGLPASAGEVVYIPLGSAGRIVIVDATQDRVVGQIEGLPAVHGLAGTPDGRFLIAGSFEERDPGDAVPAKPTGMSDDEHAAHHTQPAAGAPEAGSAVSRVSVIRSTDRSVIRGIDVPGAVHHVAISPDGGTAVVTHPNQDAISAIDLKTHKVVATVPTGPFPNYAVFSPDGGQVYVSNAGDGTIRRVDTAQWRIGPSFAVGQSPEHVVLSPDGAILYANNVDDGTVSVLDLGSGRVINTIPVGDTPHGIDLSDDGRTLFVTALGEDKLTAVDLDSGVHRSAMLSPAPYHLAAVRGARKLYVSSAEDPKIWVVDPETLAVLGEIPIAGKGHQMVQATDG